MQRLIQALLIWSSLSTSALPGWAQTALPARMIGELQKARALESRADFKIAGECYSSLLINDCMERRQPGVTRGFEVALGRRAAACLTIAARADLESPGASEHSEALRMLEKIWAALSSLEPNNPTWPYLIATRACSQGRYVEARNSLNVALKTTGGEESARQRAKLLLAHIDKFADQDQAHIEASDKAAVQLLLSGRMSSAWSSASGSPSKSGSSPTSQSSSGTVSDDERRARDAENAGDYGAASRFRSGSTTIEDGSKYW